MAHSSYGLLFLVRQKLEVESLGSREPHPLNAHAFFRIGTILLARRAKKLRKATGDSRYRTAVDPPSLRQLVWISTTRPLCEHRAVYKRTSLRPNTMKDLLFTEPIVASFSVSITAIVPVGATMVVS